MDKLNIDFKNLLPYVIEAFTFVYGEEYRSLISKKINNAVIVYYHDVGGLNDYISYIKKCKSREYSIKLLEEIGIDAQKFKKDNYTESLGSEVENILECLIDSSCFGFSKKADKYAPLLAFNKDNKTESKYLLENKLKLINYLLGKNYDSITEESFPSFSQSEEYSQLLKIINEYNKVYEKIRFKYNEWEAKLQPYEKYVKEEEKRKKEILQTKKSELFDEFIEKLPECVKSAISNKIIQEQQNAIIGTFDIASKSILESFRKEKIDQLKSDSVSNFQKYLIILTQSNYLKNLGIIIPEHLLKYKTKEDINNYLNFISQDHIKKYIPSQEFLNSFASFREKKYEEALKEYYTTRNDFIDIMKIFDDKSSNIIDYIYNIIKNKHVCILGFGGTNDDNEFVSIMFYTIGASDGGLLFQSFMHENGHIIDQSQNGSGFETRYDLNNDIKNPYDKAFRKYEKFNETLNDIFTIEAIKYLQNKGIYLIEPKEFTLLDTSNHNTALITKNLLYPLIKKFRQQIIKAKVNANPEELIKYIGKNNFEDLVDAVNKVDYLERNEVESKMKESLEDEMVIEYFEQVERVKQIYFNIDAHYANNFEVDFENSKKR